MQRNAQGKYTQSRDELLAEWQMEAMSRIDLAQAALDRARHWLLAANQTLTGSDRAA